MSSDARSSMLAAIRHGIQSGHGAGALPSDLSGNWNAIPRAYRQSSAATPEELRHLLRDRLSDYGAQVRESARGDLKASIGVMLREHNASRILIPRGFDRQILPEGFEFLMEQDLSAVEMNLCDGVLTESTLAIAETGTIVLQSSSGVHDGQGRRAASLVPDYHLCLVESTHIVATVPEAFTRLQSTANLPTTFISGPSATADIEMTRIQGVHGPRFLDVILVCG